MFFRRKRAYYYYPRETPRRERRSYSLLPKRKRRRGVLRLLGEFLTWCAFLLLITGGLIGGGMYLLHTRFDDAMRRHVETKFRLGYPNHQVSVKAARRVEGQGIELRGLTISEKGAQKGDKPIVHVDEMLLQCNAGVEELLAGKLQAKQLILRRLSINVVGDADGSWNVSRLLPMPRFGSEQVPILIENSTAQIVRSGLDKPVSVGIHQLRLTPQNPNVTTAAPGPARLWGVQAALESPLLDKLSVTGTYDVISGIWQSEGQVQGLKLGSELASVLPPNLGDCTALLDSMHLTVQGNFEATNQNANQAWCRFVVNGQATGRIEDKRLPMPLTDLKAKFSSDGQSLQIDELSATAGQATLQGTCRIGGFYEDAPCSLKLTAQRLRVDRQLVASLPHEWRETWGKVAPEGDVDAVVELDFDGKTIRHSAVVDCRNVDFAYYKFPYQLKNGHGRLRWRDGVVKFEQFQAFAHGRTVHIDGEVAQPGPQYSGFVEVRTQPGEAVPIDEKLIAALPESARRIVQQLHPTGALTLSARFERQDSNPPVTKKQLKLGLQDCSTRYELFPYPLNEIRGEVTMVDDHWIVRDLEGKNDTAWVLCNGGWGPDENRITKLNLRFVAKDVPLEDELRAALRPDAQSVWKGLFPRGTLDELEALVEFDGRTRKTSVDLTATKRPASENVPGRTITVKPTWLPYQLDEVEGTLQFQNGITKLHNVRGRHGATLMSLQGEVQSTEDGKWQVALNPLNVDRIDVTHELTTALPPRLGEAITRLNVAGPVSVSGAMVMKGMKGNSNPTSTEWDLNFDMENGGLRCGVFLDHIHGGLKLVGNVDQKGLVSQGWIDIDSLVYNGIQFTRVQGPISLDEKRIGLGEWVTRDDKTPSRSVNARVFGGSLTGNGEVVLSGDVPFKLESRLADGDLTAISREATSRRHELSGRTFAALTLEGTSKGTHTLQGSGDVQLRDADVYELPVMVRLLKLLRIKPPDETAFNSCDLKYHVEGDRIYFDSIHFDGDAISLDGEGDMTLAREINLTCFTSLGSDDVRDWFFRPLFKEAGKQLMQIRVTGSLDDPQVDREPLSGLRENFQSMFPVPTQPNQPTMSRLPNVGDRNSPPR
jgi:hypothetical protein